MQRLIMTSLLACKTNTCRKAMNSSVKGSNTVLRKLMHMKMLWGEEREK